MLQVCGGGCTRPGGPPGATAGGPIAATPVAAEIRGTASFDPPAAGVRYRTQADLAEVANAATVSLIDAQTGNTVSSSVTDERGAFVLTFQNFSPTSGTPYTLEAVKGLSVGGKPNRPGAPAVRIRTLLFWDGGWKSLTNTSPGVGIVVSAGTTALATIASLRQSAGQALDLPKLIGKVSGATLDETGTGLSRDGDFAPVLALVGQALALDQDPVGAIAYDKDKGAYRLATGVPLVTGIEPAIPTPGGQVTLRGLGFDPNPGRSIFWFGDYPAATWSVSADRTSATVAVPAGAFSAPFVLQRPGGVLVTVHPFLKLRGTVGTIAGTGTAGYRDGAGPQAQFAWSWGLAVDAGGNLYVGDAGNHRIRKVAPDGTVSTLAGTGQPGFQDGPGSQAQFTSPHAQFIGPDGTLYVSDFGNHAIRKIDRAGNVKTLVGKAGSGYADGPPTVARLFQPVCAAMDASGLYVVEYGSNRVRKIAQDGTVSTFSGSGVAGYADGPPGQARFNGLNGAALDGDGNLLVTDRFNHRIRKIAPDGTVSTFAGSGTQGSADGPLLSAQFNWPNGIAVAPGGEIYVGEEFSYRLRKIANGQVTSVAGSGVDQMRDGPAGSAELSRIGQAASARFDRPGALVLDDAGNLYVADRNNFRVRKISPAGEVTTLAGSGQSGSVDGAGTAGQLGGPQDLALDAAGNLYVAEDSIHRIRRISPAGLVTTLAGSTVGYQDGDAGSARFNRIYGVAVAPSGVVYASDLMNHRVRALAP